MRNTKENLGLRLNQRSRRIAYENKQALMPVINQLTGGCENDKVYRGLYQLGIIPPNYPMPAMTPGYATWYDNKDGFWNDDNKPHARSITHY